MIVETEDGELELQLLREMADEPGRARRERAVAASVGLHAAVTVALALQPNLFPSTRRTVTPQPEQHFTLLFAPPRELTQKDPNRAPPSKMFLGEAEAPRPPLLVVPRELPSGPPPAKKSAAIEEKPPQLAANLPEAAQLAPVMPPPAASPPSSPKLVLEDAHNRAGARAGTPQPGPLAPQPAGSVVEGVVRDLARGAGKTGPMVGDGAGGGVPDGFQLPSPGRPGSNVELLSDPMGVDFHPYLTRVLATVRRNWYAVIPESARLGMIRGRVSIQMIILRQGAVSKLVIAAPSGREPLDRAAVAGISASNPFPPLPAEFRGDHIRLQFTFLYNIPVR